MEGRSGYEGMPYTIMGKPREDFGIDLDIRSPLFDVYLLNNGFKYISTLPGQHGGIRQYENSEKGLYVSVSRHPSKPLDLWWHIDRLSDNKPIVDGIGLPKLVIKLNSLR